MFMSIMLYIPSEFGRKLKKEEEEDNQPGSKYLFSLSLSLFVLLLYAFRFSLLSFKSEEPSFKHQMPFFLRRIDYSSYPVTTITMMMPGRLTSILRIISI
jgi:hypothetical protein